MRIKARLERVMSIFPPELKKKNKKKETHPKIKMYVYIYFFFQWLMPDPLQTDFVKA